LVTSLRKNENYQVNDDGSAEAPETSGTWGLKMGRTFQMASFIRKMMMNR
jgi:hypothetical protein